MERPILFYGPMVRAILEGRKTQTRRVLNPQPQVLRHCDSCGLWEGEWAACEEPDCGKLVETMKLRKPTPIAKGDHLYVREAFRETGRTGWSEMHGEQDAEWVEFKADYGQSEAAKYRWKPSIHMPKIFSRIWLRVTDVRVQRVQDICACDAEAEGIETTEMLMARSDMWPAEKELARRMPMNQPVPRFKRLWESLNAKRGYGWEANPWVAAYTFERIEKPETGG